jgi:chromosomal replication initiation ATPase DnaA
MRSGKQSPPVKKVKAKMPDIAEVVARYHSTHIDNLFLKSRRRNIVLPRQQAVYAMRINGHTLQAIADYMLQDHTTILHTINVVKDTMHTDPDYRVEIDNILHNVSKLEYAAPN